MSLSPVTTTCEGARLRPFETISGPLPADPAERLDRAGDAGLDASRLASLLVSGAVSPAKAFWCTGLLLALVAGCQALGVLYPDGVADVEADGVTVVHCFSRCVTLSVPLSK